MKFLIRMIKGAIIGVANVIPGVSGGTMAVTMGIYDKMIESLNNLFKKFKKSFLYLLPIILGMAVGIVGFTYIIPYCLEHFAFQTSMTFAGLIVGGMPMIFAATGKAVKKKGDSGKINPVHIICFLIMCALAIWLTLSGGENVSAENLVLDFKTVAILFGLGALCAAAMVIPGISGSLLLMLFGYYTAIMTTIKAFVSAVKAFDGSAIGHNALLILPFGIGCIVGILLISKIINWLFKKFESYTYFAIIGLVGASLFAIFYKMQSQVFTPVVIIVGVVLFIVGCIFTYFFCKKTEKMN